MFWYEKHGGGPVYVELSSHEVNAWREPDWDKRKEAEQYALIHGLKKNKAEYVIKGAGSLILDRGTIQQLQQKYPDVTEDSVA
jgi:hypothetical protein